MNQVLTQMDHSALVDEPQREDGKANDLKTMSLRPNGIYFHTNLYNHFDSVRNIVRSFLQNYMAEDHNLFNIPDVDCLQAAVVKELQSLNIDLPLVQPWVSWACQVTEGFYPTHPSDLKVLISICNIAIFHIDDTLSQNPHKLHSFQWNLLLGVPQDDTIMDCLSKVLLPRMWSYFDPLSANAITVGFYEFINGTALETFAKGLVHQPSATSFPEYVRLKSGAPAQYAHWLFYNPTRSDTKSYIQAVPDLLAFINRANDILSFYKEEIAGEDNNYIHMRAKTSGKDTISILQDICNETVQLVNSISNTLASSPDDLMIFQGFVSRYLHFHTSTTRYKLQDFLLAR